MRTSKKRYPVQFEPEIEAELIRIQKERKISMPQAIRELVVQGLLSEKIDEVRESFDDIIERLNEVTSSKNDDRSVELTMIGGIFANVIQILLILRKGMAEDEIAKIRHQANDHLKHIKNGK